MNLKQFLKLSTPYQSILCLNGQLPSPHFFSEIPLPIVAADGAANHLSRIGIYPDWILGDLDSLDSTLKNEKCIHLHEQMHCDHEKCLDFLKKQKLLPCLVLGLNGGRLDHILNNLNLFLEGQNGLYDPPFFGFCINEKTSIQFNTQKNQLISLFGLPFANVSSSGLNWELEKMTLAFPGRVSLSNFSLRQRVNIEVHEGKVLCLVQAT